MSPKPLLALTGALLLAVSPAHAINEKNYDPAQQPTCDGAGVCVVPKFVELATTVDAQQVADLVKRSDLVVLDVRSRAEYEQGHLPQALQIDDAELTADWLSVFVKSKDQPVLFYGNGPEYSNASSAVLIAVNSRYTKVYYFYGGISEWRRAKLALIQSHSAHNNHN